MLKFSRNMLIGVERRDNVTLRAHGLQEDNIYTLAVELEAKLPDLKISSINGEFRRVTYNECRMAASKLQNAIGLSMKDKDFSAKIKRVVGRPGCRYFADLLLDCCDAIQIEATYGEWRELKQKNVSKDEFRKRMLENMPEMKNGCLAYSKGD